MGPPEAPWAAFRPSVRLNWRRLLGLPVGATIGAGAGMLVEVVYGPGPPLAQSVGLLVAVWVWLVVVVGPLLCTFLYMDGDWVGERGLWRRCGLARADPGLVVRTAGGVFLEAKGASVACRPGPTGPVRLRLRWSREQLAALVGEMPAVNYRIWKPGSDGDRTWADIVSDPTPLPHLSDPKDIHGAWGGGHRAAAQVGSPAPRHRSRLVTVLPAGPYEQAWTTRAP